MDKNEILEKSRKENCDEGKDFIFKASRSLGVSAMAIVLFSFAVYNIVMKIQIVNDALCSVFFSYLAFESLGKYKFDKNIWCLIGFVVGILISLWTAIRYFTMV